MEGGTYSSQYLTTTVNLAPLQSPKQFSISRNKWKMSTFRLETHRKTNPAVIGKMLMIGLSLFVAGYFVAPLIVSYDYLAVSSGDSVRHKQYPGVVQSVENGKATVVTFDNQKVTVPVAELIEQ
jgi:hypothetical protein